MATASKDKTIIIWDVETWDLIHVMAPHTDDVTYLDWSPDDKRLTSCSKDKTARLYDTEVFSLPLTFRILLTNPF